MLSRLFIIVVLMFSFFSCEEEASIDEFLSPTDLDSIITGEEETQIPIRVAFIKNTSFVAIKYNASITGSTTNLFFENEEGDTLTITVQGTTNITYTAGANSDNLFIATIKYAEDNTTYTTDPAVTNDSIGSLGLLINNEDNTVSVTFEFEAYNEVNGNDFIQAEDIPFDPIPLD